MEGLLHWDFSPDLAVEAQVHRRFGSDVHFSPSSSSMEFFLVVTFSSASFALSEESVGIALQCCIGGDRLGFRVCQTSDRRFRFLVASKKVGHYICGLQDRVWPDFVCHFSLYRGVQSHVKGFMMPTFEAWSSHDHIVEVLGSSDFELAKFGLSFRPNEDIGAIAKGKVQHSKSNHIESANISIGQFCFNLPLDQGKGPSSSLDPNFFMQLPKVFGQQARVPKIQIPNEAVPPIKGFAKKTVTTSKVDQSTYAWCYSVPGSTLQHLEDLRVAKYYDQDILEILNVPSIPPMNLVFNILGYCSRCNLLDHQLQNCPGPCDSCAFLGKVCVTCAANRIIPKPDCAKCLGVGHPSFKCRMGWRCRKCLQLGHWAKACTVKPRVFWRVKQCKDTMEKSSSPMKQIWVKKVISSQQPSIQSNLHTFMAGGISGSY